MIPAVDMLERRGHLWSDEDIALLRELALAEVNIAGIARQLLRTREAIYSKARKLGLVVKA